MSHANKGHPDGRAVNMMNEIRLEMIIFVLSIEIDVETLFADCSNNCNIYLDQCITSSGDIPIIVLPVGRFQHGTGRLPTKTTSTAQYLCSIRNKLIEKMCTYAAVAENISKLREGVKLTTDAKIAVQRATIHNLIDKCFARYNPTTGAVSIEVARSVVSMRTSLETLEFMKRTTRLSFEVFWM